MINFHFLTSTLKCIGMVCLEHRFSDLQKRYFRTLRSHQHCFFMRKVLTKIQRTTNRSSKVQLILWRIIYPSLGSLGWNFFHLIKNNSSYGRYIIFSQHKRFLLHSLWHTIFIIWLQKCFQGIPIKNSLKQWQLSNTYYYQYVI
jgi:hypothetical protein